MVQQISTCVGFQAIIQATKHFSKGLRYTGVGAVGCARSEMWLPNGVGNLQKGERCVFSYVGRRIPYFFHHNQDMGTWTTLLLVSYGISMAFESVSLGMTSHVNGLSTYALE